MGLEDCLDCHGIQEKPSNGTMFGLPVGESSSFPAPVGTNYLILYSHWRSLSSRVVISHNCWCARYQRKLLPEYSSSNKVLDPENRFRLREGLSTTLRAMGYRGIPGHPLVLALRVPVVD